MKIDICSIEGEVVNSALLSEAVFDRPFNEPLIHQVVVACLAKKRQGTHKQKTRAEVSGGGSKPWKQKGSGRARAGTTRGPLWRHGGVTFAAVPGNYAQKINKKMYRGAIKSILSELVRSQRLKVISDLAFNEPKTKHLAQLLQKIETKNALIIVDNIDHNLALSARNLPHVSVSSADLLDPVKLIAHEKVLITEVALRQLNEGLDNE